MTIMSTRRKMSVATLRDLSCTLVNCLGAEKKFTSRMTRLLPWNSSLLEIIDAFSPGLAAGGVSMRSLDRCCIAANSHGSICI